MTQNMSMAERNEDSLLELLPGNRITGINIDSVEKERKMYWDKFYMKYSALSESESDCLTIDQIDDISLVKVRAGHKLVEGPISRTARKYLKENAGLVDELSTIAGPPASDEEEISEDDSEEDDDVELEVSDHVDHILTPIKTDIEEIQFKIPEQLAKMNDSDGEVVSENEATDDENLEEDSDEDLGLFSPIARPKFSLKSSRNIVSSNIARTPMNKLNNYEKPCLDYSEDYDDTKCSGCDNFLDESSMLLSASNIALCDNRRCDNCLLHETHKDCDNEDCQVCIDVVATVKARNLIRQRISDNRRQEESEDN